MTFICQTCNKQANKKGMIIVEEPDWGNSFFFCSWKCLANFSLKKLQEEVKNAKKKKPNWYLRRKLNNPDADLIQTKNGKVSVKEMFKITEEERNAKQ